MVVDRESSNVSDTLKEAFQDSRMQNYALSWNSHSLGRGRQLSWRKAHPPPQLAIKGRKWMLVKHKLRKFKCCQVFCQIMWFYSKSHRCFKSMAIYNGTWEEDKNVPNDWSWSCLIMIGHHWWIWGFWESVPWPLTLRKLRLEHLQSHDVDNDHPDRTEKIIRLQNITKRGNYCQF